MLLHAGFLLRCGFFYPGWHELYADNGTGKQDAFSGLRNRDRVQQRISPLLQLKKFVFNSIQERIIDRNIVPAEPVFVLVRLMP